MTPTFELKITAENLSQALQTLQLPDLTPGESPPPDVNPFPPNPGDAPFPSPDRSAMMWLANTTPPGPVGHAYLMDGTGRIWTLSVDPAQGGKVAAFVNGLPRNVPAGGAIIGLIVAGPAGVVWGQLLTGQFFFYNTNNGTTVGALPPPVSVTPPGPPPLPADPPHGIAPGSSGTVILCGPSQNIKTLTDAIAIAKAGDTIQCEKGASFNESVGTTVPVLITGGGGINGVGGAKLFGTNLAILKNGKGGFVPDADIHIDGFEIFDFGVGQSQSGGTSGIRPNTSKCGWLAISNCYIPDCQNGLNGSTATVWDVRNTLLENNGLGVTGDGFSHNIYMSTGTLRITLTGVNSRNPKKGHCFKSRALVNIVVETDLGPSMFGACFDFPDGTPVVATFQDTHFEKGQDPGLPVIADHKWGAYGEESQNNGMAGIAISDGFFDLNCPNPFLLMTGGTVTLIRGTKSAGSNAPAVQGGTLIGSV